MTLAKRLEAIRAASASKIDAATSAIMHRATEDLRASGIRNKILGAGDAMPEFALANHSGERMSSTELFGKRSLVLTFFRGHW